jgi:hypothetical protein
MRVVIIVSLILPLITGCQTNGDDVSDGIARGQPVTARAAGAIAGDMASRLAERVPPASTRLTMTSEPGDYAVALETALRGWGYTVVSGEKQGDANAVRLSSRLQDTDGQVLAQLSTPTITLGRSYTISAAGAVPASPLSVMQRN